MNRDERLARITDPAFWSEACPALSIDEAPKPVHANLSDDDLDEHGAALIEDGYFRVPEAVDETSTARLLEAVHFVRANDLPPVFVFVFDETWSIPRRLNVLLERTVGEGYQILPDFWAWFVDPKTSDAGWRPHRDRAFDTLDANGLPTCLTLWMALTDATPDNGCIYVLPASRDPFYRRGFTQTGVEELQAIRALPAHAGTVFGWNQAILHWGARSTPRARGPRVSVAFELQRPTIAPLRDVLLDPNSPPSFAARLALIGRQVLQYRHMHPVSDELEWLAEQLAQEVPG